MLAIKFSRVGKKKKPTYKIIVLEKGDDPWGNYLEQVGNYNPHTKEASLKIDRIKYWIDKGAQPSASVNNLLIKQNVIEGAKQKSVRISKKRAAKKEGKKAEEVNKAAAQKQALTDQAEVQAPAEEKPAAAQEGKPAEAQATDATKAKPAAKEETEQPQKLKKS